MKWESVKKLQHILLSRFTEFCRVAYIGDTEATYEDPNWRDSEKCLIVSRHTSYFDLISPYRFYPKNTYVALSYSSVHRFGGRSKIFRYLFTHYLRIWCIDTDSISLVRMHRGDDESYRNLAYAPEGIISRTGAPLYPLQGIAYYLIKEGYQVILVGIRHNRRSLRNNHYFSRGKSVVNHKMQYYFRKPKKYTVPELPYQEQKKIVLREFYNDLVDDYIETFSKRCTLKELVLDSIKYSEHELHYCWSKQIALSKTIQRLTKRLEKFLKHYNGTLEHIVLQAQYGYWVFSFLQIALERGIGITLLDNELKKECVEMMVQEYGLGSVYFSDVIPGTVSIDNEIIETNVLALHTVPKSPYEVINQDLSKFYFTDRVGILRGYDKEKLLQYAYEIHAYSEIYIYDYITVLIPYHQMLGFVYQILFPLLFEVTPCDGTRPSSPWHTIARNSLQNNCSAIIGYQDELNKFIIPSDSKNLYHISRLFSYETEYVDSKYEEEWFETYGSKVQRCFFDEKRGRVLSVDTLHHYNPKYSGRLFTTLELKNEVGKSYWKEKDSEAWNEFVALNAELTEERLLSIKKPQA